MKQLVGSFKNAFRGLFYALKKEQNLRIEFFAAFLVLIAMVAVGVTKWEAVILLMVISMVIILETLNTLLERLVNLLKPRVHPQARVLKDIMATSVFLAALSAAAIGTVIFWSYLFG